MPVLGQLFCGPQLKKISDLEEELNNLKSRYQQLQKYNERLTLTVRTISQGVFSIDLEGRVDYWSRGMELLTGISKEEAVGKNYEHLFTTLKTKEENPMMKIIEGERKLEYEIDYTITKPNNSEDSKELTGTVVPLSLSFLPMKNDLSNLIGIVVEVQNLKQRKDYEEMQLDFVAVVTHELRTPATSIKGYLSLLLDEGSNLSEEQKKFLRRAYISNERQIHTIESLLTVSKIEHEFLKPELDSVQIEAIVAETTKFIREDVQNKGLELRLNYPQFGLPKILADVSYLRQIIYVILSNAVKFTESGYVEVSFTEETETVTIHIKDTGSGIDQEMQGKIFDRFTRGERPFTEDTQGIGLGLYTAKAMVENMGGKIWVESTLGEGSTFSVSFPKG
ncbi:PAS domain-containing sensor histidine kinase [candidate division WWE3 bacterium]|uniref:histidine kinase n=1 Tax=candidate division WWE3 bacterium TaxID=2053526 RepID=A0A955LGV7_UNCKA|nr:PAS domain-containing sensor histidine kinase [candidate division WWE3 bacterium]